MMDKVEVAAYYFPEFHREDMKQEMRIAIFLGETPFYAKFKAIDYLRSPAVSKSACGKFEHVSVEHRMDEGFDIPYTMDFDMVDTDVERIMSKCSTSIKRTINDWFWKGLFVRQEMRLYGEKKYQVRKRRKDAMQFIREELGIN